MDETKESSDPVRSEPTNDPETGQTDAADVTNNNDVIKRTFYVTDDVRAKTSF